IMFIVAKIGIFTPKQMRKVRKYAFILILVAAAIITPSTDPYNMMIVAVPLYALYELGIIISAMFVKTTMRPALGSSSGGGNITITPDDV
ncbi:MAG TPA: twin-arginine translocase subunit TatC, partial [Thermomicrobiales bacterium]|nr:twin-arginine translocase subunit TatC [Thermomicrobiales bacterium]